MKILYDAKQDTVRILFRNAPIERSVTEAPGLIVDYDAEGWVVGLELMEASRQVHDPGRVDFTEPTRAPVVLPKWPSPG